MLLYLSLILCLLQNMYQADWHGYVDACIKGITAADETQVGHSNDFTINIEVTVPEAILRTVAGETLVARQQCPCPKFNVCWILEVLSLHVASRRQVNWLKFGVEGLYLHTVVSLSRSSTFGHYFQPATIYDILKVIISWNSKSCRRHII